MEIKPIERNRIYAIIVDHIKESIAKGDVKPGEQLPSEREMADLYKVSRAVVREAMSVLEAAGLVEIRPGVGIFVANGINKGFTEHIATTLLLERNSTLELLELRIILESEAAFLAASRATKEDLRELEDAFTGMKKEINDCDIGKIDKELRFHYLIARSTHNTVLMKVMNTIADLYLYSVREYRKKTFIYKNRPKEIIEEHKEILEAIKARDPSRARKAMLCHLRNTKVALESLQEVKIADDLDRLLS